VYDDETSHLVAAARVVAVCCACDRLGGPDWALDAAGTALSFLRDVHGDDARGGFHWLVAGTDPADARRVCCGHAVAVLACARAVDRGVPGADDGLADALAALDRFRPWGYQPGHHLEWTGLCCELDARHGDAWFLPKARALFDLAVETGWQNRDEGFVRTLAPDGSPVVEDRYGWVVAEGIGAAARLAAATDDEDAAERDRGWHDRLRAHADARFRAPFGGWYERTTPGGEPTVDPTGPTVDPGYHPVRACLAERA
jgi:mannose/cellobiose epimerase-like protein (N-acyl-D-glucosamine 2-epimerase family)